MRKPADLDLDVKLMATATHELLTLYRDMFTVGHSPIRRQSDSVPVSVSGVSDPTSQSVCQCSIVSDPEPRQIVCPACRLRDALRDADKVVNHAKSEMVRAMVRLTKAVDKLDPKPTPDLSEQQQRELRLVTKADLADARKAQQRRNERGEGYG